MPELRRPARGFGHGAAYRFHLVRPAARGI